MRTARALVIALAFLGASAPAPAEAPAPSLAELDATIERLTVELRRAGADAARTPLERSLANAWVVRARLQAKAGRRDEALDGYDRALGLAPSHPQALVELAWIHLDDGRPERARALAETAVANHPDDGHARALLGEILYRENRLDDALEQYRAAREKLPGVEALATRIAKIERELAAEREYRRADSSHFIVRFDGARDDALGRRLLDVLERELDDLRREIDVGPLPPLTVILYTSRQFRETTGAADEVVGLFDGKVRLPVGGVKEVSAGLVRVIRHELAHALLHARGRGNVPLWLHEGFAQLVEPRDPARSRARTLEESNGNPSLEPFSYPRAHSFTAWLDARSSRARLLWLIDLLAQEVPENEAFERAFGASKTDLVEAWAQWARTAK